MAMVLDTGALLGYERGSRMVVALLASAQKDRVPVRTSAGAVAQAWRDGARQARLARLLRGVDERGIDSPGARRIGTLLGVAAVADVVDAAVIDIAVAGDEILTSDPGDLARLAEASGKRVSLVTVGT